MRAVFLDYSTMGGGLDLSDLQALFSDLTVYDYSKDEQIAERIGDAEFIFTNKIRLSDALMQVATKLRYIGLTATGTDNIDLAAARRHGIAVANIRKYCTESVVEHVFGVLLMLTHNLHRYDDALKAGAWQQSQDFCMLHYPIRQLSEMTIGIVGYGALGRGVAATARHFGMEVLIATRPGSDDVPTGRVSFPTLLAESDVISLHCPLTDATRHLFAANTIAAMRPGALLINTARGALVDAAALVAALERGHLGGAAIDVLEQEPPVDGNPLLDYAGANLIVTPHMAWGTDRARQNAMDQLTAAVAAFLRGDALNRVA